MNTKKGSFFSRIRLPQTRWNRGMVLVLMAMLAIACVALLTSAYIDSDWHRFTFSEKVVDRVFFAVVWPVWIGASLVNSDVIPFVILIGWVIAGLLWAIVFELCATVKKRVSMLAALSLFAVICAADLWATSGIHRVYAFSPSNACVNNLRQIDNAKQQWALENNKASNDAPTWADILPYLGGSGETNHMPKCPEGGQYLLGKVGEAPKCSIGGYHSLTLPP